MRLSLRRFFERGMRTGTLERPSSTAFLLASTCTADAAEDASNSIGGDESSRKAPLNRFFIRGMGMGKVDGPFLTSITLAAMSSAGLIANN